MEFIVPGAPRSANAGNRSRRRWREEVSRAAREWSTSADPIGQELSVRIIYFFTGETALDVDNMAKPLLDALKGLVFHDDQQVSEILVRKTQLSPGLTLGGASPSLLETVEQMSQQGTGFVYIRIDPGPDHSRIP
jgi:crossover junction endodeoxyribonuclease RusA